MVSCPMKAVPAEQITSAFLRMYYKLRHHANTILDDLLNQLISVRSRQMLWHPDVIELNKQISNLSSQSHMLTVLNQQGAVDPDIFIFQSNQLAQQLRKAKRQKEKLLERDGNDALSKTRELMEILEYGPENLDTFDGELFRELVEKSSWRAMSGSASGLSMGWSYRSKLKGRCGNGQQPKAAIRLQDGAGTDRDPPGGSLRGAVSIPGI